MRKEIICTLGPASMNERTIKRLEDIGVNLFRVNLSHTKLESLASAIDFIHDVTSVPLCLDTEGAQVRTGYFHGGEASLLERSIVYIHRHSIVGDSQKFNFYPHGIIDDLKIGDFISIDFNSVFVQIIDKGPERLTARVLTGGIVGNNKAVTVERNIIMPSLTDKDKKALAIGIKKGICHIALSFTNKASDVDDFKSIAGEDIFTISKIESIEGLMNLKEIAAKSDALLLDRGDLSRQVPVEHIPRIQKDIIKYVDKLDVKIYVATNLLESMVTVSTPTRAEVSDIFNTLNDGADGLVLAAETAIGAYPIQCADMVERIIKQFSDSYSDYSFQDLQKKDYFLLVEPHGGILVNRVNSSLDEDQLKEYKKLQVDINTLLDAEQIAIGTFSPLEGFMVKKDLESVLNKYCLSNGVIWPLPIVLQVKDTSGYKINDTIALVLTGTDQVYALIHIEEIYKYDLDKIAQTTFGTKQESHPGVQFLKSRGNYFLGGKIELIKRLPSDSKYYEITPRQARSIFESKGWSRVVGFHTRNVIHKAHEYIQLVSFDKHHCDGLFIHPVVGPKKKGDYIPEAAHAFYFKSPSIMYKSRIEAFNKLVKWLNA